MADNEDKAYFEEETEAEKRERIAGQLRIAMAIEKAKQEELVRQKATEEQKKEGN